MGVAIQDALAATLIDEGSRFLSAVPVPEPLSVDVWLDGLRSYGTISTGGVEDNEGIAIDGIVVGPVRASAIGRENVESLVLGAPAGARVAEVVSSPLELVVPPDCA